MRGATCHSDELPQWWIACLLVFSLWLPKWIIIKDATALMWHCVWVTDPVMKPFTFLFVVFWTRKLHLGVLPNAVVWLDREKKTTTRSNNHIKIWLLYFLFKPFYILSQQPKLKPHQGPCNKIIEAKISCQFMMYFHLTFCVKKASQSSFNPNFV